MVVDQATEPAVIHATSGACPICDEHFDDLSRYTTHLAVEHDLVDEDGSRSSFGVERVASPARTGPEISVLVIPDELSEPPRRPPPAPVRTRPVGLIALVLLLAVGLGGLIAMRPDRDGRDDEVLLQGGAGATATTTTEAATRPPTDPPSTAPQSKGAESQEMEQRASEPRGPVALMSSSPVAAPAVSRGGGQPTGPPATTPPAPTTTTSSPPPPPPPAFGLPSTSGAVVDGCEHVKNRLLVTYSWRFDGGTGWRPASHYSAAGGGWYRDVVSVPRDGTTTIASVEVLDQDGHAFDVPLAPVLSSSSC